MSIIQNKNKSISSSLSIKNQIKEEENHNNSAKLSQYSDKNIEFNNKIEFDFNLKPENSIHDIIGLKENGIKELESINKKKEEDKDNFHKLLQNKEDQIESKIKLTQNNFEDLKDENKKINSFEPVMKGNSNNSQLVEMTLLKENLNIHEENKKDYKVLGKKSLIERKKTLMMKDLATHKDDVKESEIKPENKEIIKEEVKDKKPSNGDTKVNLIFEIRFLSNLY